MRFVVEALDGGIGLPNVREYRRKRLLAEHETRMAQLDAAEAYAPDLNAVLMLLCVPKTLSELMT